MLDKPIEIGRFGRTHGLKGYIKLYSYTDPTSNIFNYQPWYLLDHPEKPVLHGAFIRETKDGLIAKIIDIETIDAASPFVNQTIYIDRSVLPVLSDEYYWEDLIGLAVINEQKQPLGHIASMHHNGAHNLMLVQPKSGQPFLIPYVDKHVICVNEDHIIVNWVQ